MGTTPRHQVDRAMHQMLQGRNRIGDAHFMLQHAYLLLQGIEPDDRDLRHYVNTARPMMLKALQALDAAEMRQAQCNGE